MLKMKEVECVFAKEFKNSRIDLRTFKVLGWDLFDQFVVKYDCSAFELLCIE